MCPLACKKNLLEWLSQIVDMLKDDKEEIVHCWRKTELLRAWDRSVQVEAFSKKEELFPNIDKSDSYFAEDEDIAEDEDAGAVDGTRREGEDADAGEGREDETRRRRGVIAATARGKNRAGDPAAGTGRNASTYR